MPTTGFGWYLTINPETGEYEDSGLENSESPAVSPAQSPEPTLETLLKRSDENKKCLNILVEIFKDSQPNTLKRIRTMPNLTTNYLSEDKPKISGTKLVLTKA